MVENIILGNRISSTLHVSPGDCGGYSGAGLVHFAEFRLDGSETGSIELNRFVDNYVNLTSDTPDFVDVVALELAEAEATISVSRVSWAFTPDGMEE